MEKIGVDSAVISPGSPFRTSQSRRHRQVEKSTASLPARRPAPTSRVSAQQQVNIANRSVTGQQTAGSSPRIPIRVESISPGPSKASPVRGFQSAVSHRQPSGSRLSSVDCLRNAPGRGPSTSETGSNGPVGRSTAARAASSSSRRDPPSISKSVAAHKPNVEYSIGIETEFVLRERIANAKYMKTCEFLCVMAAIHNTTVRNQYPYMQAQIEYYNADWRPPDTFETWVVIEEPSVLKVEDHPEEYGVEMKSPKLRTSQESNWKDQVKATWDFVKKNYIVSKTTQCSTHIHISALHESEGGAGFSFQDLKKIAQCIIYFEPALEALTPEERRGNIYASSNWIDNRWFTHPVMTRSAVIDIIETCGSQAELILLMSPTPQKRFFAWNFRALNKFGTIEFRKGGASLNGGEAIAWAELVLLFVQSAMQTEKESLKAMPANIRGLKTFLGADKLKDLGPLLKGKNDDESVQPKIVLSRNDKETASLEKKLRKDDEEQRKRAKKQQG